MPLPSGMIGFEAAAGAGAGGAVGSGAAGAVAGGAAASAARSGADGAVAAGPAGAGAAGAVDGGSAASGDGLGGTSLNWSPAERAAAVSTLVGEAGRPRAVATPTVSTTSERNRT